MALKLEGDSDQVAEVSVEETTAAQSSTLYPTYVRTLQEAEEVLNRFENNTKSRFCVWRSPKDFGKAGLNTKKKKIYWDEFALEYKDKEKVDKGVPFVLMGKKIFDCHHGKDRGISMKKRAEKKRLELNEKRKRNMSSPGKKLNCPAQVVFTEIILLPEYKLTSITQYSRKQASRTLRNHFKDDLVDMDKLDRRIYISLPDEKLHEGHAVGEGTESCERMHTKVSDKIIELVAEGVIGSKEMKRRLDIFVRTGLCPELWKPCHSNRRYYPTKGVVRNKMYNAYIKRRLAMIDQDTVGELVKEWQSKNPDDKFFFRPYDEVDEVRLHAMTGISVEEELEDELKIKQRVAKQQFLFIHQTPFQGHLLKRYGNDTCFLDSAYRTAKYALPIFFLTVKTNVDYQVAALLVLQDESKYSAKEALELLKSWNPEWKPKIFTVDNDQEEILAAEEVFPDCKVFISDFYREQDWERWLSQTTNDMIPYKEALLHHLRRLANANSKEQFEKGIESLERSDLWNDTYGKVFRAWIENTWLTVKERWVWYFKKDSQSSVLTINNTIDWQNKDFCHEQLVGHGNKLLSEMLKMLIENYVHGKRDAYFEQNSELSATSSKYSNLPEFFHNRPRRVIDHITERITSSYEIANDDITVDSYKEGEFLVNCRRSDVEYKVHFGNNENLPHCECEDWARTMLPCKHFVAIMRDFKEWNWSRFPESYRCSPYLTLDATVNPGTEADRSAEAIPTKLDEPEGDPDTTTVSVSVLDSSQFQELTAPKISTKSKSGACRELLNDINNLAYQISDDDVINRLSSSLQAVLTEIKLAFIDDDVVILEDPPIDSKVAVKSEEKPKGPSESPAKTKRPSSSTSPEQENQNGEAEESGEPARKVAKTESVHAACSQGAGAASYSGNETIEEPVLEEMNHMEILNIDYYRSLNANTEEGTPEKTATAKENGDAEGEALDQSEEPRGDAALYKALEMEGKKEGEIAVVDTKTPSSLPKHEARLVQRNEMLTVDSINLAQSLLRDACPHLKGFQNVARGAVQAFEPVSGDFIQILHDGNLHWVCTSNVSFAGGKDPAAVAMFDSMNQGYVAKFTKQQLASFLCIQNAEMKLIMKSVQQQANTVDCGVFAIAFATSIAFGQDPSKQRFDVSKLRNHLFECLRSLKMSPFPEMKVGAGDIALSKRKFYTIELFCSCRMPYEKPKSEADLMAQCGGCKEWFHQRCEKIALEIFKASGINFFCSSCLKKV